MRLDKLTIGQFKNLKDVTIDFDQDHWVTVVIGWNGTGKSNVLEALAIIFRDFIAQKRRPSFAFRLDYRMGTGKNMRHIHIEADPKRKEDAIRIHVTLAGQTQSVAIRLTNFLDPDAKYLPRYVFSYYSGESSRMQDVFEPYLKDYYHDLLTSKQDPAPKRLFYALPAHSQFVLLAFLIQSDQDVKNFLERELGIDPDHGVESVLFVLREPPWPSKDGDFRFWFAKGLVQRFLDRLMTVSLAPITINRRLKKSIWNKNQSSHEYKYLFVKDVESLVALVGDQPANEFFRDLESTFVSELIEEIRIRVRLKKNDGTVIFRELSEGEQQLLTVLGLLRFTAEDESLILLDEPDTHLNPRWSVDYLSHLKSFVGQGSERRENSHVVLTTHNPLAIAELVKEQVQILYREGDSRAVRAEQPAVDPRGMGFAGIVTSDMFGLGTSLDKTTNDDLLALHRLSAQKVALSADEKARLGEIRKRLEGLDFNFASRDRLEQEYLRARFDLSSGGNIDDAIVTPENKQKALDALVQSLLHDLQEKDA